MQTRISTSLSSLSMILFVLGQFFLISNSAANDNSEPTKLLRKQELKAGKTGRTITYGPVAKGEIWVFTDLECYACKKLHQEIEKLNNMGVQAHVMAFPRHGIQSPGYNKMVSIWCSRDPAKSLNQSMEGEEIGTSKVCQNPVQAQFNLGRRWGVMGTPTIVFKDGTQWSGYYPADRLAQEAMARTENQ